MSALALREPLDLTGVAESLAISVRGHSGSLPIANDRFSAQGWKNQIRFCALTGRVRAPFWYVFF